MRIMRTLVCACACAYKCACGFTHRRLSLREAEKRHQEEEARHQRSLSNNANNHNNNTDGDRFAPPPAHAAAPDFQEEMERVEALVAPGAACSVIEGKVGGRARREYRKEARKLLLEEARSGS